MKNRSTDLIDWNETHSEGVGRSATRYALSFAEGGAAPRWIVVVDGMTVCAAKSIQDAFASAEGLEALRCILQGRPDLISDQHWRAADLMASEMTDAAAEALGHATVETGKMRAEDQRELAQNLEALQALSSAVRLEARKRQRESAPAALPFLN